MCKPLELEFRVTVRLELLGLGDGRAFRCWETYIGTVRVWGLGQTGDQTSGGQMSYVRRTRPAADRVVAAAVGRSRIAVESMSTP